MEERLQKELKKYLGMNELLKSVETLKKENSRLRNEMVRMEKEMVRLAKKVDRFEAESTGEKRIKIVDIIEEKVRERSGPVKVVDLREELKQDERVSSGAENFYSVIATAMKNSPNFQKTGPGEFEYTGPAAGSEKSAGD